HLVFGFAATLVAQERTYSKDEFDAFIIKAKAHIKDRLCEMATDHYSERLTDDEIDQLLALSKSPLVRKTEAAIVEMQKNMEDLVESIQQELFAYAKSLGQPDADRLRPN
ncbi:MAG: DUF2059 domain-containing protein, partial [Nitrososphaera sp.]|nr:DUF2059 domain-containing protein [Nitrososphaera sp.]